MTDLGVISLQRQEPATGDVEPVSFTFAYTLDGEEQQAEFHAHGWIPFAYLVEYWSAPVSVAIPSMLAFLGRSIVDDDWPRFYALIKDERASADPGALEDLVRRLLAHYEQVDPTTARSAGPKSSASGRRSTGGGSSGRSRAKAPTSR